MAVEFIIEFPLGVLLVTLLLYKYMTADYSYWKKLNVPYLQPTFPYGNIKDQVTNKSDIGACFKDLYDQMPGERYFGIFELGKPALVLKDVKLIKSIMVTDFSSFDDRGHIHENVKKDFLAALHLFNLKKDAWKRMRTKMSPTFTSGRMKRMYNLMNKCSEELSKYLENVSSNNETVELKDLLSRFTSDAISSCLFGLETNAVVEKDSEVRKISRLMFPTSVWNMIKLMLSINHPFIYDLFGLEINYKRVKTFCMQVAKDTYTNRVENNVYRDDLIDLLIKIKQNKNLLEDEKIISYGPRKTEGEDDGLYKTHDFIR